MNEQGRENLKNRGKRDRANISGVALSVVRYCFAVQLQENASYVRNKNIVRLMLE